MISNVKGVKAKALKEMISDVERGLSITDVRAKLDNLIVFGWITRDKLSTTCNLNWTRGKLK